VTTVNVFPVVNAKGFVQWEWMLRIIQKKGEWYGVYIVYGMCEELSGGCVVIEKVFLSFLKKSTNSDSFLRAMCIYN